jgi:hypothetical protein
MQHWLSRMERFTAPWPCGLAGMPVRWVHVFISGLELDLWHPIYQMMSPDGRIGMKTSWDVWYCNHGAEDSPTCAAEHMRPDRRK